MAVLRVMAVLLVRRRSPPRILDIALSAGTDLLGLAKTLPVHANRHAQVAQNPRPVRAGSAARLRASLHERHDTRILRLKRG
jgi:hypothetical protein